MPDTSVTPVDNMEAPNMDTNTTPEGDSVSTVPLNSIPSNTHAVESKNNISIENTDETSSDSSVVNLDKTTVNVRTKFSDMLTNDCCVVIKALNTSELAKGHSGEKEIKKSMDDIPTTGNLTDSGKDTMSSSSSTDSEEVPQFQLFNKDQGRPRRRIKRVKCKESSPCINSDSNFEKDTKKNASNPI